MNEKDKQWRNQAVLPKIDQRSIPETLKKDGPLQPTTLRLN